MTSGPAAETALARALAYARHGWPVFPCKPGRKEPDTAARLQGRHHRCRAHHGLVDRGARPQRGHRHRRPRARRARRRRAARRQRVSGLPAAPAGGPARRLASPSWRHPAAGCTPTTPEPAQGSGRLTGCHLDFKAAGGYVLAPPSAVGGKPYRLIRHQQDRHSAGGRLDWAAAVALLDPPQRKPQAARPPGHAGAARLAGWVAQLPEGNRNAGLFWAACRAAETGQPRSTRRTGRGSRDRRAARGRDPADHRLRAAQRRAPAAGPRATAAPRRTPARTRAGGGDLTCLPDPEIGKAARHCWPSSAAADDRAWMLAVPGCGCARWP